MGRRFEYVCAECGRPFGRHYDAEKHVFNPRIHNGMGIITSLTDYIIGVIQGRYRPPTYNKASGISAGTGSSLPRQQPPPSGSYGGQIKKRTDTMFDIVHKYANLARDWTDFEVIMTQQAAKAAEISRLNPLPEFLIGYVCDKCYTSITHIVPSLDSAMSFHECNPDKVRKLGSPGKVKNIHKGFVDRIKLRIDEWTKNTGKYLIAIPISPEYAQQSMPPYLKKLKAELPAGSNHYLNRAIRSAKKDGMWIALNDYETRNFLEMTYASVAIFEVRMVTYPDHAADDDGGSGISSKNSEEHEDSSSSTYEHFLVRIVPPQYVEAKRQNDEFEMIKKELLKDMEESLKGEEDSGRTNVQQQEVEDTETPFNCAQIRIIADESQEHAGNPAAVAPATITHSIDGGDVKPRPEKPTVKKENSEDGEYTP